MWKLVGACLVIGSMGMAGMTVASFYSRRSAELRSLQDALQMLDTEILYAATPLPSALKKIGQSGGDIIARIFAEAGELIAAGQGCTVAEAWGKALQKNWSLTALNREDYAILYSFGELLGISDCQEQHKNIALTSLPSAKRRRSRGVTRRKIRVYGNMGGFWWASVLCFCSFKGGCAGRWMSTLSLK
jgi:stage III sporulation protein AB